MQIELEGIPKSMKASYQARLKSVQRDLARCKKQHKELNSQVSRTALLGRTGQHVFSSDESTSDRTRLLAGTEMLSDGTRRLQETHRIALEAEEQGADVLRNLRGQREQIENAQNTVSVPSL
jgi:vesicle transport through interaction with t-SNAREs 1